MKTDQEDDGVDQVVGADKAHLSDEDVEAQAEEKRAKALGWSPKEQWRGAPEKWVPADEFIDGIMANRRVFSERMERIESRQTEQQRRLEADNAELRRQVGEATQVLGELNQRQKTVSDRAYARAKADLEAKAKQAVVEADVPAYEAAQVEIKRLEEDQQAPAQRQQERPAQRQEAARTEQGEAKIDPAIEAWIARNPWYRTNMDAADFAAARDNRLRTSRPELSVAERLVQVEEDTKKRFPELTTNERRDAPAAALTSRGGNGTGNASAKTPRQRTYDDLPGADKAQCDRFVATIPGYTKKDYMAEYLWPDEETSR